MFSVSISFFLFLFFCVFFLFGYLLVQRASHCTVEPCRLQSATLQNNASIICLHSRLSFAVLAWGVDAAAGWNPRTNLGLSGRVTYSLPLGRTISSPLLYKKNFKISLSGSLASFISLSLQGYRICSFQKKKKLCSKAITSDLIDFFSIKLDCEGERERETDRQFQKVSLPPVQHEAPLLIRLYRQRGRER